MPSQMIDTAHVVQSATTGDLEKAILQVVFGGLAIDAMNFIQDCHFMFLDLSTCVLHSHTVYY